MKRVLIIAVAAALDHLVTIDDVEVQSNLDFLPELPADDQATIEGNNFFEWASANLQ